MRAAGVIVADGSDRPGRLEGWKMIAAFVGRDERTAKRWEVTRGLPVRRLPGENRSMVFAYAQELAAWRDSTSAGEAAVAEPVEPLVPAVVPRPDVDPEPATRAAWRSGRIAIAALALAALLVGAAWLLLRRPVASPGGTADPQAAALYRQGKLDWSLRTRGSLEAAREKFHGAIRRDPDFAQAYVGLAQTYELLREFGGMADAEAYPKAEAAARQALSLAPDLAEAHSAFAFVLFWWDWDRTAAEREFRAAIRLDPSQATAHHWLATALQAEERLPEALTEIRRAQELEPGCAACVADEAGMLITAGRSGEAAAMLRHLERVDPSLASPHLSLAGLAWASGDVATYFAETEAAGRLRGDLAALAQVRAQRAAWQRGGRSALIAEMVGSQQRALGAGASTSFSIARTLAMAGDVIGALGTLEGALRVHEPALMGLAIDPAFASLRGQPRFAAIVAATRAAP